MQKYKQSRFITIYHLEVIELVIIFALQLQTSWHSYRFKFSQEK